MGVCLGAQNLRPGGSQVWKIETWGSRQIRVDENIAAARGMWRNLDWSPGLVHISRNDGQGQNR